MRSRLPMNRIAEMHGNTNVYLRRWRKNQKMQMWIFNGVTKMVTNMHCKNYCLEIPGNGGQNMVKTRANCQSRWWTMWKYDGSYV